MPTGRVHEQLRTILGEPLELASATILYAENASRKELQYQGMSEFRDALEHIRRALNQDAEEKALTELDEAFEHIRRGATESVQDAAMRLQAEVAKETTVPGFYYVLAMNNGPMHGSGRREVAEARRLVREGRKKKSKKDTWVAAIADFRAAIATNRQVLKKVPLRAALALKILEIVVAVVGIASVIALGVELSG